MTYAVAAPISAFGSLRMAYGEIHTRLAKALQSLGVDTVLAGRPAVRPSGRRVSCFAQPEGGEILVNGRKLVGSAQVRRGEALLQHGSILLDKGSQSAWFGGATTLAEVLGRPVTFVEVSEAVVASWEIASVAAR
jgi:lipoate-protein ligase A